MRRGNSVVPWLAQVSYTWSEFLSKSKHMYIYMNTKVEGYTLALVLSQNYSDLCKITEVMCLVTHIHSVANQQLSSVWHRSRGITHARWASKFYCQTGLLIGRQDQRRYYKPIKVIGTDCQVMSSTAELRVWSARRPSLPSPLTPVLPASTWINDETADGWTS